MRRPAASPLVSEFSGAGYFRGDMDRETYYQPTRNGYEIEIAERLRHWAVSRARRQR